MIYELNHLGMQVRDLDASLGFYLDVLGGKVVSEAFIPASKTDCVYLQLAGGLIELLHPQQPAADHVFGLNHIAFMSDDLDGDYERLTGAGLTGLVRPKVAGSGRGRLAFLADPNGARVELLQRDEEFRIPAITGGPISGLDHFSVRAEDLAAAEGFYGTQLPMLPLGTARAADGPLTMSYFALGSDTLQLLQRPTAAPERIDHIGLRVQDVADTSQYLAGKGIRVEPGFPKASGSGHGQVSMVRDPDGSAIELVDRPDLRDLAPRPAG